MYKNVLSDLRRDATRPVLSELEKTLKKHVAGEVNKCIATINAALRSAVTQKLSPTTVDVRAHYIFNIAELLPEVEFMYRPALEKELAENESVKILHRGVAAFFSGCVVTSGLVKERPARWIVEVSCVA
jgi:hypothetical protein